MPFLQFEDIQEVELFNGIRIRAMCGTSSSVAILEFPAGAEMPPHNHPNEQIGIVEDGELEYTIGDRTMVCRAGTAFVIPPGTTHSARVVSATPARVLDIFTPPRGLPETQGLWR